MQNHFNTIFALLLFSVSIIGQPTISDISTGDGYMRTGNFEQAIGYYSKALLYNPNDTEALIKRAKAYNILGKTNEAREDLDLANDLNPYLGVYLKPSFRSELLTTKQYNYSNQDELAFNKSVVLKQEYQNILNENKSTMELDTLLELALINILNSNYDDAEYFLELAENDHQNTALYYDLQGLIALKSDEYEYAIDYFKKAIQFNPGLVPVYHNLAIAYKKAGEFELSEKAFKEALTRNASIPNIHFGKANLLSLQNENKEAEKHYQKAISLSNNYYEAKANYSVLLKTAGEYTLALKEINQTINDNPTVMEHYYIRGSLYFIYGEYDKAIKDFDEYLLAFKNDNDALFNRGVSKLLAQYTESGCLDIENAIDAGYEENNADIYWVFCND